MPAKTAQAGLNTRSGCIRAAAFLCAPHPKRKAGADSLFDETVCSIG